MSVYVKITKKIYIKLNAAKFKHYKLYLEEDFDPCLEQGYGKCVRQRTAAR